MSAFLRVILASCIALLAYASFVVYPRWNKPGNEAVIAWDASGYYWYLPSLFIYHDLKEQRFSAGILQQYAPTPDFQQAFRHEASGHYVLKYSSGTAMAMLPAFLVAHGWCWLTGEAPADGFSRPYQLAIQVWWLLIAVAGILLYARFLRPYFSDAVTAVVLLLLVFGSNFLNWAAIDVGQTHPLLFTLYAALLLGTRSFYRRPTVRGGAGIGLLIGWMILIRPSEAIAILLPLLWSMESLSRSAIRAQVRFLARRRGALLAATACGSAVVLIQPAYWKYATGEWIVYSYGDQGFSFLHPHFRQYTFDWARGWLIYAPVMVLAIAGIFPFLKRGPNRVAVLAFSLLNYYIVASWDVWQYGSRAMIQSYPVLGILMGSTVAWLLAQRWRRMLTAALVLAFTYYNLWWTYFAHGSTLFPGARPQQSGLLDTGMMTGRYFLRILGRWSLPSTELWKLKDTHHIYEGPPPRPLWTGTRAGTAGQPLFYLDGKTDETPHLALAIPATPARWLRVSLLLTGTQREWGLQSMPEMLTRLHRNGEIIGHEAIRIHRFLNDNEQKRLHIDVLLKGRRPDSVSVFLRGHDCPYPLRADSLRVILF